MGRDVDRRRVSSHQRLLAPEGPPRGRPDVDRLAALAVSADRDGRLAVAAGVLYSRERKRVLEDVVTVGVPSCSYVPGLLALREAPILLAAARCFERDPDCLLVQGHGYAHPRRFGLASHLGRLTGRPSIGCAQKPLVGEHEEPGERVASLTDVWDEEPVGYACRSHPQGNPIYLSAGHRIAREHVPSVVTGLLDGRTKLPVPLRRARRRAADERRRLLRLADPFRSRDAMVLLVGGALRDLLSGRSPRDYDLLVDAFPAPARRELAERMEGSVFTLDEDRNVHRCTGEHGTVDVTVLDRSSVTDDLRRRDFTVNALALDLDTGDWLDPTGGFADLHHRRLRPCRADSLQEDPVRVLRAYRHRSRFGFRPTDGLREALFEAAGELDTVSAERVVEELLRLSAGPDPAAGFVRMEEEGILRRLEAFRATAPREVERLARWESALEGHRLLDRTVHGDVTLYRGLMAARAVLPGGARSWPFHARVVSITEATGEEPRRPNSKAALTVSPDRLVGGVLGEGMRQGWSVERAGEAMARVSRYLARWRALEKQVAGETEDPERIQRRKQTVLGERLPELWRSLLTPVFGDGGT